MTSEGLKIGMTVQSVRDDWTRGILFTVEAIEPWGVLGRRMLSVVPLGQKRRVLRIDLKWGEFEPHGVAPTSGGLS